MGSDRCTGVRDGGADRLSVEKLLLLLITVDKPDCLVVRALPPRSCQRSRNLEVDEEAGSDIRY